MEKEYNDVGMENLTKRKKDDGATRPYLLNRFIAGFIDLVIIFVCFALLEAFSYYVLFEPLGYKQAENEILEMNKESHLYKYEDGSYVELSDNLEEAIIYFYSNDKDAINDNKLDSYNKAKVDSGIDFNIATDGARDFYKAQYDLAIKYFKSNTNYVSLVNKTYLIVVYTLGICLLLSLTIFYLIIPLTRKEGETIGQIIFKICLIDSTTNMQVKKSQIVLRFLVLVSINYGLSAFIYFVFKYFTLLPALITLFMMSFVKKNRGPHDLISRSHIILKHRMDAMDALKAMSRN